MAKTITLINGDGIGSELISAARAVIDRTAQKCGFSVAYRDVSLPRTPTAQQINAAIAADAVLFGHCDDPIKRDDTLSSLRKSLKTYAGLYPAAIQTEASHSSLYGGYDVLFVRELAGGIYFGEHGTRHGRLGREAYATDTYSEIEIERVLRIGFEQAEKRRGKLLSVDQSDKLETGKLWRTVLAEVAPDYPTISVECALIDEAIQKVVNHPTDLDVVVASNMLGKVLTDVSTALRGGILCSAAVGRSSVGLYMPDTSNTPIGAMLAAAMLLDNSLGQTAAAELIRNAVVASEAAQSGSNLSFEARTDDILRRI